MKELKTSQDTELAEFLYKLGEANFNWYKSNNKIRSMRANQQLVCPISAVYGGPHYDAIEGTNCPGLSETVRELIWRSADDYPVHDPYIRQALLRAVGLDD